MKSTAAKRRHVGVIGFLLLVLLVFAAPAEATRSLPKLMDSYRTQTPIELSSPFEASPASSERCLRLFPWLTTAGRPFRSSGELDERAQYPPYAFALRWTPDNAAAYQIDPEGAHSYNLSLNLNLSGVKAGGDRSPGIDFNRLGLGELIKEYVPDAQLLSSTLVANDRFLHGRPYVSALGLYDHRARFYDPDTLHFLQPDPLGPVDSPNLYQGFGFDGLNVRDPYGLRIPNAMDKRIRQRLVNQLATFEEHWGSNGRASITLIDTDIRKVYWPWVGTEYLSVAHVVTAGSESEFDRVRARLQAEVRDFDAAVERADATDSVNYRGGGLYGEGPYYTVLTKIDAIQNAEALAWLAFGTDVTIKAPAIASVGVNVLQRFGARQASAVLGEKVSIKEGLVSNGRAVKLYRAVSEVEYKNLMRMRQFEAGPNSLGGKFFAESPSDAARWGNALEGAGNYRVVEVEIPSSVADSFMRWERLDNIGPARYGELDDLNNVVVRQVKAP